LREVTVTRYQDKPEQNPQAPNTVQTTRYRYDALGRRIDKTDAFGRTSFVYDGDLLTAELRGSRVSEYLYEPDSFVPLAKLESGASVDEANEAARTTNADSSTKRERLVDEGKAGKARLKLMLAKKADSDTVQAGPVEAKAANDAPNPTGNNQPPHKAKTFQLYYYHCDQIGAPQELTDEQGRIVWAAQYKVWGETAPLGFLKTGTDDVAVFSSHSRPVGLAKTSDAQALNLIDQPLRFQGQYFDAETGLHYNRFRYYDPVVGRFVHQDPIGLLGGNNSFLFAPNPLDWIDPLGLVGNRANRRAGEILRRRDAANGGHAHCRHGAQTTRAQQEYRARTGVPPDQPTKTPQASGPNSTRYLSNVDQLDAIQKGEAEMRATGRDEATIDMKRDVGEGYLAGGGGGCLHTTRLATTWRHPVTKKTKTSFPQL
jgi:RHS repeat-associated protein